jgi:Uncharacterized conserved protein
VQPEKITDAIGGRSSLKTVCSSRLDRGREMLFNRYRILLTRGMKGTSVYFEDSETYEHVRSILGQSVSNVSSRGIIK